MAKKKRVVAYKSSQIIHLGDAEIKHWDELSANELKIAMLSASKVKLDDTQETEYSMTFTEFADICKFDEATAGGQNYKQIYQSAKKLARSGVDFQTPNGDIVIFNWLDHVTIRPKSGCVTYHLDPRLLPFYKTRSGSFAIINLLDYMPLKGRYALLLYEFLAKWRRHGSVYQSITDLRAQLHVSPEKYKLPADFMKRVVNAAVDEINHKTTYTFKVRMEDKLGKWQSVEGINFILEPITHEVSNMNKDLLDRLVEAGVVAAVAVTITETYSRSRIVANITRALQMQAAGKIRTTLAATMYAAIREDYAGVDEINLITTEVEAPDKENDNGQERCPECGGTGLITDFAANKTAPCPACSPVKPSHDPEDPDAPWKTEGDAAVFVKALADAMK